MQADTSCAVDSTTGFPVNDRPNQANLLVIEQRKSLLEQWKQNLVPELNRIGSDQDKIMSIYGREGRFAAAFYVQSSQRLFICPEFWEQPPLFPVCQGILNSLEPDTCLVNNNIDSSFHSFVRAWMNLDHMSAMDNDESQSNLAASHSTIKPEAEEECESQSDSDENSKEESESKRIDFLFLTHSFYDIEKGKSTLLLSKFPGLHTQSAQDLEQRVQSIINFNNISLMKAIAALVQHLQALQLKTNPAAGYRSLVIRSIEKYFKANHLFMDTYTYESLEIFTNNYHPATLKYGQTSRSGENLFEIFNTCRSWTGKKEMRRMFLSPQTDRKLLNDRLDVVEYFINHLDSDIVKGVRKLLTQIQHVDSFLKSMASFKTKGTHWIKFSRTLKAISSIAEILDITSRPFPLFVEINSFALTTEFGGLFTHLHNVLDLESTKRRNEFTPCSGICSVLDAVREKASLLERVKQQVLKDEAYRLNSHVEKIDLVHIRNVGFRLKILATFNSKIDFQPDLECCRGLQEREFRYYKSSSVDQLNEQFGDLPAELFTCEMLVMLDLTKVLQPLIPTLKESLHLFGQLETCVWRFLIVTFIHYFEVFN